MYYTRTANFYTLIPSSFLALYDISINTDAIFFLAATDLYRATGVAAACMDNIKFCAYFILGIFHPSFKSHFDAFSKTFIFDPTP